MLDVNDVAVLEHSLKLEAAQVRVIRDLKERATKASNTRKELAISDFLKSHVGKEFVAAAAKADSEVRGCLVAEDKYPGAPCGA